MISNRTGWIKSLCRRRSGAGPINDYADTNKIDLKTPLISSLPQILHPGTENKISAALRTILKNAELREEVNLEKISTRVISLSADLLRYEILITQELISDKAIVEIVDDIFMPLVRRETK